jgi:hypothetical protein
MLIANVNKTIGLAPIPKQTDAQVIMSSVSMVRIDPCDIETTLHLYLDVLRLHEPLAAQSVALSMGRSPVYSAAMLRAAKEGIVLASIKNLLEDQSIIEDYLAVENAPQGVDADDFMKVRNDVYFFC